MVACGHRLVRHPLMLGACMPGQLCETRAGLLSRARGTTCAAWWGWEMLLEAHCLEEQCSEHAGWCPQPLPACRLSSLLFLAI